MSSEIKISERKQFWVRVTEIGPEFVSVVRCGTNGGLGNIMDVRADDLGQLDYTARVGDSFDLTLDFHYADSRPVNRLVSVRAVGIANVERRR